MKTIFATQIFLAELLLCCGGLKMQQARSDEPPRVQRAYVDDKGGVHIVEEGGKDISVPKEKDQVASDELKIAEDKRTVGWMAEYDNPATSYPIPLGVVVWKDGQVRQNLGDGLMIYDWRFWEAGKQVAFCSGTVHGDSGGHCELHEALTGKKLAELHGHLDTASPAWARGLQN